MLSEDLQDKRAEGLKGLIDLCLEHMAKTKDGVERVGLAEVLGKTLSYSYDQDKYEKMIQQVDRITRRLPNGGKDPLEDL